MNGWLQVAYLLNGDIADRGDNSVEIFVVVLIYKLLHPNRFVSDNV